MLLLATIALAGLVLMLAAHVGARRGPRIATAASALLCTLLVARSVLAARPDWEWSLFPWPGYAYVQGFTVYALAATFFAVAAATMRVRWNRVVVLLVGLAVLAHGVWRHSWIAWPETHGDERTAGADHHVRQSSPYTCGPAACASALSHCGVRATERELATACLTRCDGTRLFDLYRGIVGTLGDRGFAVSIESLSAEEIVARDQVLIGTNSGRGHALCVAVTRGEVVLHDPLQPAPERGVLALQHSDFRSPAIVIRALEKNLAAPPHPAR